ncbi:hypothetical protein KOI35_10360 [Actinoplanes bogorensis]|uniref:Uncharacterized protein n=1 Tax=Paractinoplanes bogorensis TaxID=1610840 RepID=A0ABS5YLG9_9ACTN|nr:hypothetical protein [Actinoplanes bogorensis]MBU2663891.1 hypothetical protein [Actinoplanes bogorensis]
MTTQEQLLAHSGTSMPQVTDDMVQKAAELGEKYAGQVVAALENRAATGSVDIGQPTVGPYVAFDLLATTPIQFGGPPPYQPSRILAGGEPALILAFLFVNSTVDVPHGFAVPPTKQLSNRTYRVSMEQINLTAVSNGPDAHIQDVFGAPAATLTVLPFWFTAPQPGPDPILFEANFTADIVGASQPYAAFASTIVDFDSFKVLENVPVRYLVYAE